MPSRSRRRHSGERWRTPRDQWANAGMSHPEKSTWASGWFSTSSSPREFPGPAPWPQPWGLSGIRWFLSSWFSGVLDLGHAVCEGDRERVERWLPAHGLSHLAGALGVKGAGDQVEALQCGLARSGSVLTRSRLAVAGIHRLDGIGGAQHLADLHGVVEEWGELLPRVAPESADGRVGGAPLLFELLEARQAASRCGAV